MNQSLPGKQCRYRLNYRGEIKNPWTCCTKIEFHTLSILYYSALWWWLCSNSVNQYIQSKISTEVKWKKTQNMIKTKLLQIPHQPQAPMSIQVNQVKWYFHYFFLEIHKKVQKKPELEMLKEVKTIKSGFSPWIESAPKVNGFLLRSGFSGFCVILLKDRQTSTD